jgi:phage terminase small subunit
LTVKQKKFVEEILAGKTAVDAYRAAYSTENMSQKVMYNKAAIVKNHPAVAAEIARREKEIQEQCLEKAAWERQNSIDTLKYIISVSAQAINQGGKYNAAAANAATKAVEQMNKMLGFNEPDKAEISAKISVELADYDDYAD